MSVEKNKRQKKNSKIRIFIPSKLFNPISSVETSDMMTNSGVKKLETELTSNNLIEESPGINLPGSLQKTSLVAGNKKVEKYRVLYCGTSARRSSFLKYCFNGAENFTYSCNPIPVNEPNEPIETVVKWKLKMGLQSLSQTPESYLAGCMLVASDSQTYVTVDTPISKSKPKLLKEVQKNFLLLSKSTAYKVASCCAYIVPTTSKSKMFTVINVVSIDQQILDYLATDEGFKSYLKAFDELYTNWNYYGQYGLPAISPLDISCGISLPLLFKFKAVKAIDGVTIHDELFPKKLASALLNVAIGIPEGLLEHMGLPNPSQIIQNWSWLQGLINYCTEIKD